MPCMQFGHDPGRQTPGLLHLGRELMAVVSVPSGPDLGAHSLPFRPAEIAARPQGLPAQRLEDDVQVAGPAVAGLDQLPDLMLESGSVDPEMRTRPRHDLPGLVIRKAADVVDLSGRNAGQVHPAGGMFSGAEPGQHQGDRQAAAVMQALEQLGDRVFPVMVEPLRLVDGENDRPVESAVPFGPCAEHVPARSRSCSLGTRFCPATDPDRTEADPGLAAERPAVPGQELPGSLRADPPGQRLENVNGFLDVAGLERHHHRNRAVLRAQPPGMLRHLVQDRALAGPRSALHNPRRLLHAVSAGTRSPPYLLGRQRNVFQHPVPADKHRGRSALRLPEEGLQFPFLLIVHQYCPPHLRWT